MRVATRDSKLAVTQAQAIIDSWKAYTDQAFELIAMKTSGDKNLAPSFFKSGDKGIFTKELDQALLEGQADIAVHSLKDLAFALPSGLELIAVGLKQDPRDAWVSETFTCLEEIPKGGRIGTSSVRRSAQLQHYFPDLEVVPIRGNIHKRLQKAKSEAFDGIILAASGLIRMGLEKHIQGCLPMHQFTPAVGQGCLAVTARKDTTFPFISAWQDKRLWDEVMSLRFLLGRLEGGCSLPLGAVWQDEEMFFFMKRSGDGRIISQTFALQDSYLHTAQQVVTYLRAQHFIKGA